MRRTTRGSSDGGTKPPSTQSVSYDTKFLSQTLSVQPPPFSPLTGGGSGGLSPTSLMGSQRRPSRRSTVFGQGGVLGASMTGQPTSLNAVRQQQGLRIVFELHQCFESLKEIAMLIKKASVYDITLDLLKTWATNIITAVDRASDAIEGNSENLGEAVGSNQHQLQPQQSMTTPPQPPRPNPNRPSLDGVLMVPLSAKGGRTPRKPKDLDTAVLSPTQTFGNFGNTFGGIDLFSTTFSASTKYHSGGGGAGGMNPMSTMKSSHPQNAPHLILSSLYLTVESLCQQVRADRGILYVSPTGSFNELRAMVVFNKLIRGEERIANLQGHPAGVCFTTQFIVNCARGQKLADVKGFEPTVDRSEDRKGHDAIWSTLSCPIPGANSQGKKSTCLGVLHIANKDGGSTNFDADDEHVIFGGVHVISGLMQRCARPDFLSGCVDGSILIDQLQPLPPKPDITAGVAPRISSYRKQLIFRTSDSFRGAKIFDETEKETIPLSEETPLVEVATFISRMTDCWLNAVVLNKEYEKQNLNRENVMRKLRDDLRTEKMKLRLYQKETLDELSIDDILTRNHEIFQDQLRRNRSGSSVGATTTSASPNITVEEKLANSGEVPFMFSLNGGEEHHQDAPTVTRSTPTSSSLYPVASAPPSVIQANNSMGGNEDDAPESPPHSPSSIREDDPSIREHNPAEM